MTNKIKTPPEDRIYDDDDGFFLRAASVCVKDQNESEVLLVSSHSKPGRWIIPGGKIQANEDPGTSAAREAMEEAGARGRLGRTLGTFADPDRKHRTTVFVLHVDPENGGLVDDFEEKDHRLRRWFQIEEAKFILAKPLHAKYLNALEESASSTLIHIPNNVNVNNGSPTTTTKTTSDFFSKPITNDIQRHNNTAGSKDALSPNCYSLHVNRGNNEHLSFCNRDTNCVISAPDKSSCGIQSGSSSLESSANKSQLSKMIKIAGGDLVNSVNFKVPNGVVQGTNNTVQKPTTNSSISASSGLIF